MEHPHGARRFTSHTQTGRQRRSCQPAPGQPGKDLQAIHYAGTSPLTVASGKKRAVLARHVRNRRLYGAIDQWACWAPTISRAARTFYDQRRAADDLHHKGHARPGQPTRRHPARLRTPPQHLPRTHRLGPPTNQPQRTCGLTTYEPGISNRGRPTSMPPPSIPKRHPIVDNRVVCDRRGRNHGH